MWRGRGVATQVAGRNSSTWLATSPAEGRHPSSSGAATFGVAAGAAAPLAPGRPQTTSPPHSNFNFHVRPVYAFAQMVGVRMRAHQPLGQMSTPDTNFPQSQGSWCRFWLSLMCQIFPVKSRVDEPSRWKAHLTLAPGPPWPRLKRAMSSGTDGMWVSSCIPLGGSCGGSAV